VGLVSGLGTGGPGGGGEGPEEWGSGGVRRCVAWRKTRSSLACVEWWRGMKSLGPNLVWSDLRKEDKSDQDSNQH